MRRTTRVSGTPVSASACGEHDAGLEGFRHHLGRTRLGQLLEVGLVAGAGTTTGRPGRSAWAWWMTQRRLQRVEGHHQRARTLDAGRDQGLAPRRVAIHHGIPGRAPARAALRVEVERDIGHVLLLEEARQVLAASPVAAITMMWRSVFSDRAATG